MFCVYSKFGSNPSFFFFSSRRRHTRLQGDWSSDVCSSDLQSPIAAAYDRTPLHAQYQWHRTAISKCVDRLDEPRPTGFRFLGELKSSRGSVALCGPTWVGRTHAGVRCGISATRNSLRSQVPQKSKSPFATFMPSPDVHTPATRSGVPQRPRPAPDAHASLLKLPP